MWAQASLQMAVAGIALAGSTATALLASSPGLSKGERDLWGHVALSEKNHAFFPSNLFVFEDEPFPV